MPELKPFEYDLISVVASLEMKLHNNPLQEKMKQDIIKIKDTKDIIVLADKTTNSESHRSSTGTFSKRTFRRSTRKLKRYKSRISTQKQLLLPMI